MNAQIFHILIPILFASLLNIYIYAKGWNSKVKINNLPPGYIIAIIWTIIFGLLGYAHYILQNSLASYTIILAILYCLSYPFLTSGLQPAYTYNVIAFAVASITYCIVYYQNRNASIYIVPFVLWSSYVSIVVYDTKT